MARRWTERDAPLSPYRRLDWSAVRRLPAALPDWGLRSAETYLAFLRQRLAGRTTPPGGFVIFAMGRTGSNLLASLLHCHPDIDCEGEILSRRLIGYTPWPRVWLQGRRALHRRPRYGFRLKVYHLTVDQRVRDPARLLSDLCGAGWKIIHLSRRNLLRQALSNLRLIGTGKAQYGSAEPLPAEKIVVDCRRVIELMRTRALLAEQEKSMLAPLPHLSLCYEDDLSDGRRHQAAADRAFAHLELPRAAVRTALARIHAGALPELIANYEEVRDALAGTPYAPFLEEGAAGRPGP